MHVVTGLLGRSAAALRLPSLLATSLAAGVTGALGLRLARMAGQPAPAVTGLLAGLLYAAAPQTTYYAQDARPYGLVTLLAAAASYLLVVAVTDGRRRCWAGYAAAIALTGLASLFALLLLAAHGVTLLLGGRARLRPWLAASAAAVAAVSPLIVLGYRQDGALAWVTRPGVGTLAALVSDFSGSRQAILLVIGTAAAGAAAGLTAGDRAGGLTAGDRAAGLAAGDRAGGLAAGDRAGGLAAGDRAGGLTAGRRAAGRPRGDAGPRPAVTVVTLALPWLVLPPLILLAVSLVKPVYVERYVVFGQPALALLSAAGLVWLARLVAGSRAGRGSRRWPGRRRWRSSPCSRPCSPGRSRPRGSPRPGPTTCARCRPSSPRTSGRATRSSTSRPRCGW